MIDLLVEPMSYEFMRRALVVVAASGVAGALLSCWLVHMGWSLMGDAVSHAVLPGVVIAAMTGIPFAVGALISALIAVTLIGAVREGGTVREDAAMGIVFTALFSLGLVLIARFPSQQDLHSILFGSVLGVRDSDLVQVLAVSAFTVIVLLALRRDLIMLAFDRLHAHTLGLRTRALTALLLATLATATVAGVQSVGVILVVATLIIPGATAQLLADTFRGTMLLAVVVALLGGVTGLYVGYYADLPPGPVVVLTQSVIFVAAQLFAPRRGVIPRAAASARARRSGMMAT
ncbi:metal ABC transporter permease [Rhodococcus sp. IEGM 1408]|uniref:metal ABC transporter permease n=1 Tax=Rhodococcus sp. IEGM 1408 TaxID=3082220 RepID=UPI002955C675|nr:metal ABC transporter permease [Rhodococcus sp. IEGM 1408]MDV8000954.1 metal ABC transporter permease [Rhodococcus sp. IEGM 1408]